MRTAPFASSMVELPRSTTLRALSPNSIHERGNGHEGINVLFIYHALAAARRAAYYTGGVLCDGGCHGGRSDATCGFYAAKFDLNQRTLFQWRRYRGNRTGSV